jgi:hypothetical protein
MRRSCRRSLKFAVEGTDPIDMTIDDVTSMQQQLTIVEQPMMGNTLMLCTASRPFELREK